MVWCHHSKNPGPEGAAAELQPGSLQKLGDVRKFRQVKRCEETSTLELGRYRSF